MEPSALVTKAKLAELAHRYSDMMDLMIRVAEKKTTEFSVEERNLLGIACKNVLSARRVSWRILMLKETNLLSQSMHTAKPPPQKAVSSAQQRDGKDVKHSEQQTDRKTQIDQLKSVARCCRQYRLEVEKEISQISDRIISIITAHLLPKLHPGIGELVKLFEVNARKRYKSSVKDLEDELKNLLQNKAGGEIILRFLNPESITFFFKMMGDIYRYLAETACTFRSRTTYSEGEAVGGSVDSSLALAFYYLASEVAKAHLAPSDPIRLGLALNFSVFYHQNAFDEALYELPKKGTRAFTDSSLIMGILRDNVTKWTKSDDADEHSPHDEADHDVVDDDDDEGKRRTGPVYSVPPGTAPR
eukprot:jgi/Bigna1/69577/fgenesh1_pg.9_\